MVSVSCSVGAEELYKTISKDGKVLYSNTHPGENARVKVIQTLPAPPPEVITQAQERVRELQVSLEGTPAESKNITPKRKQSKSFSRKHISKLPSRYKSLIRSL